MNRKIFILRNMEDMHRVFDFFNGIGHFPQLKADN